MKNDHKLRFSIHGEMFIIDLDETLFFEADDHYTHVCTTSGQRFLMSFGLSEVEAEIKNANLPPESGCRFARLGRRHIVNLDRIFNINVIKQHILLADRRGKVYALQMSKPVLRKLMESMNYEE